jgi:poly[(R)-3-hydroxyalkanoate] polymerase subunit PhaC
MVATVTPNELVARVRRDAERNVLRVRNGLKHLAGVGRPQLTQTPKETAWAAEKVELWHYPSDQVRYRTPLLFIHSLVSRSYVFDLVPGNSFVETMRDSGFDVYLADWGVPDELESGNTLETYTDGYIPTMVREVQRLSGAPDVNLFGYCFGGVLSLLALAGNPDLPVRSLAVMATPTDFSHMGPMTSMMQEGRIEPEDMLDATGNVPAEVMLNSFRVLSPTGDVINYVNLWQNLWNDDFVAAHQVMTQWAQDHIPFPGAAFCQMGDLFSRQNLLATGKVPLGGRIVDLEDITVPFLSILGERDHIVPPDGVGPLLELVGSTDVEELRLAAGHVGVIAGRTAQRRNIPAMADWLARHSELL